jgi:hypothetical protein
MPRMHGERPEEFTARRAHAIEAHVATLAKEAEYRLKRENGVPIATVEIPAPCQCSKYSGGPLPRDREIRRADNPIRSGHVGASLTS